MSRESQSVNETWNITQDPVQRVAILKQHVYGSDVPCVSVCVCSHHSFSYIPPSKIKAGKTNDILFRIQGKFFLPPDFLTLWRLIDTSTSDPHLVPFFSMRSRDVMASIWSAILLFHNFSCNQPGWHAAMRERCSRSWQALACRRTSKCAGKTMFVPAFDWSHTHTRVYMHARVIL